MKQRTRQTLIIGCAVVATLVIISGVVHRSTCAYYGYQTDRETRYAPFVGCMVKVSDSWIPRHELRVVQ